MYSKLIKLRIQKSNKYWYFIDKNHPLAVGNSGKVYYHRHVASITLNRWLNSDEIVHHIDENKSNNAPENLLVMKNSEHTRLHKIKSNYSIGLKRCCKYCREKFEVKANRQKYCSIQCASFGRRKVKRPQQDTLRLEVEELGYCAVGKKYGVSDNAIRKWLRTT